MGFRNLRLFKITGRTSGRPTYGTPIQLQSDVNAKGEVNAVDLSITKNVKERSLQADDTEIVSTHVTGFEGTLNVYDVNKEAYADLFGYETDSQGGIAEVVNSDKHHFGIFFEGTNAHGVKYQKYIFDVEFTDPDLSVATDTGDNPTSIELKFKGYLLRLNNKDYQAYTVYEGTSGFIENPASVTTMKLPVAS